MKRKGLYVRISLPKQKVKWLQAYYLQGGKWKRVKNAKGNIRV